MKKLFLSMLALLAIPNSQVAAGVTRTLIQQEQPAIQNNNAAPQPLHFLQDPIIQQLIQEESQRWQNKIKKVERVMDIAFPIMAVVFFGYCIGKWSASEAK